MLPGPGHHSSKRASRNNMILTCPSCGTRYLVADTAIGNAGRKVRCAACKHSWFEHAEKASPTPVPHAPTPPQHVSDLPKPDLSDSHQPNPDTPSSDLIDSGGHIMARAPDTSAQQNVQPILPPSWVVDGLSSRTAAEETPSPAPAETNFITATADPFAYQAPFQPRRNKLKLWTIAAIAIAALLIALNIALWALGGVEGISEKMGQKPPIASLPTETALQLAPTNVPERRRLDSGHEILSVSGRIDNPTSTALPVPAIRAELLDDDGKTIYSWTIPAPVDQLAGGTSIPFDGVTVDIPATANRVRLSFVTAPARSAAARG